MINVYQPNYAMRMNGMRRNGVQSKSCMPVTKIASELLGAV